MVGRAHHTFSYSQPANDSNEVWLWDNTSEASFQFFMVARICEEVSIDTKLRDKAASAGWPSAVRVLGAVPAIIGKWTFVAVVYDQIAQTVKLQVDDMVLTKTGVPLGPGQNQLFIGGSPIFNNYFEGLIDNVFVFDNALTDQELACIRILGAQAFLKPSPGLLLLLLSD